MRGPLPKLFGLLLTCIITFTFLYFGIVVIKGLFGIIIGIVGLVGTALISLPILKKIFDKE